MVRTITSRRTFLGWSMASVTGSPMAAIGPLRIVFPYNAGSGVDATARALAQSLRTATGRSSFVDNKPGAGGVIGAQEVARAAPDGNTVLFNTGAHTTNAVLMRTLPYDPLRSFAPVTMVSRGSGWVLVVGRDAPYLTLQEFIDAARKAPGQLTYGSSGNGGSTHVMAALFCKATRLDLTHVPYKGAPINDLIAGVVDASFQSISGVMEMLRSGRLRALGVSSDRRVPQLSDVPTFKEFGIDAKLPAWTGVFAPARTPDQIVASLYQTLVKAGEGRSFQEHARIVGSEVVMMSPHDFSEYLSAEIAMYRRILPQLKISLD